MDHLRPGPSADEIDTLTERVGLTVPREARTWWAWHDGSDGFQRMTASGFQQLTLARAIEEVETERERAANIMGEKLEFLWLPGWLPVAYSLHGGAIVVDGANGVTAECAVVAYTEPEMNAGESGPRAGSLGEMVTWWIEAFDTGVYGNDRAAGWWIFRDELMTREQERTRLI